ncbi:hypothetical protein SAMN04488128_105147 [Chitinophaga eiseniae]|uniref:Barstar (Barnase inhibitor) n=2 Tax=Chitinophaga eiseniae TaxID=634771 RepID=A0A1T4TIE9_9BACT|nr:hypothetical protein SAMN04488128_105147 [Chitinophaga eiseniae]
MINVVLSTNGEQVMCCSHIWLQPYAPDTTRSFRFTGILFKKTTAFDCADKISVRISMLNRKLEDVFYIQFGVFVFDYRESGIDELWIDGLVCDSDEIAYRQGIIDVFDFWQRGQSFDWFSEPINSLLKRDYIVACSMYSGLNTQLLDKDIYEIDISLIKEQRDFFYLASITFIGDRAYLGHDFHSFTDCWIDIYRDNGWFNNKKVRLLNTNAIHDPAVSSLISEAETFFRSYKFSVELVS